MANKLLIFTRSKMKNFFLVILLLFFGTGFASAQKYGYIDSDYILNLMPEYTLAKDKLDKLAKRWTKEIDETYAAINSKKDNFNREEVLLPEEEKLKRKEEIEKLETEARQVQTMRFGVSGDYFQKRKELIKPIQDQVFEALKTVASKKKYSFVFDKANQSNLVFADSKYDLTKYVLKELGIKIK